MKVISPSSKIMTPIDGDSMMKSIELAGRTCYKSEDKITAVSAVAFNERILSSGHHSVIEHVNITVKFVCDRGVTHELVRHRLASYSQESTRYANYSKDKFGKEITVIRPLFWSENSFEYAEWHRAMESAEKSYMRLIELGAQPEQARSVLPNSLKTEIVMTCNIREWRHVLMLRCSHAAHPQMREITLQLLSEFNQKLAVLFGDIYSKYRNDIEKIFE